MPCDVCNRFPAVPTSWFEEVAVSLERHGELYRCRACGTFLEVIAEERGVRFTPVSELKRYYPKAFENEE